MQLRDFGCTAENGDFRCSAAQIALLERQAKIAASTAVTTYLASITGEHGELVERLKEPFTHPVAEEMLLRSAAADAITALSAAKAEQAAEVERLREVLVDLVSWFPEKPSEPEWRLMAGKYGADDAISAARALSQETNND